MNLNVAYLPRATTRERAIAPHGSGAGASERCYLAEALGGRYQVLAPEHYGSESSGPWTGEHAFSVADETARTLALIEKCAKSVRLVGRSYGAGLPLHVTLARPEGIASLAAYELAFHLLPQMGEFGVAAYMEITAVARHVCQGVVTGDDHGARRPFVDYWSGPGAFDAMHVHVPNSIDPLGVQVPAQLLRSCRRAGGQERLACLKAPIIAEEPSGLLPAGRLMVTRGPSLTHLRRAVSYSSTSAPMRMASASGTGAHVA
jgi:pimeloyl-ACP methyl ester carboxylesterase